MFVRFICFAVFLALESAASAFESPADPLPPLRENRPSAAQLAGRSKAHPYLFFDARAVAGLRAKAKADPFRSLAARIEALAEKDLALARPPLAAVYEGIPRFLPDGSYNPAEIEHHYDDFYRQGYLVKDVIPTLGFCYQLTGDTRFGDAGKAWLLDFARRPKLARADRAADFDAANMAFGIALGYDWLAERMTAAERAEVAAALTRLATPIAAAGEKLLRRTDPQKNRTVYGNNHQTRTHGLFGLTALALLYDVPAARGWLDMEVQLQRDRLYPSAWAPDGEHVDAWDHFDSSLDDPIPFLMALRNMGGEDLFGDPTLQPRFRGMAHFWLYGLENRLAGSSKSFAWLALAGRFHDPVAQWIATQKGGLERIDPIFAYLFYDEHVKAEPPDDPDGSVYFPYSGMVKLCADWRPGSTLVPFRCGPEIGKDLGDQNGFRLRTGGEWLLPRLPTEWPLTESPTDYHWALQGWFRAAAQNVVVGEPAATGDYAQFARTGKVPLVGGLQVAAWVPPAKLRADEWLSGPPIVKTGVLEAVKFDPAVDYVRGEAHRAYTRFPLTRWVRQVLFVKASAGGPPPYILICDEVEAPQPETLAWQLMSGFPLVQQNGAIVIRGKQAALDVHLLAPVADTIVLKETPAPAADRTPFLQWTTPNPTRACFFVTALVPHPSGTAAPLSLRLLPASGGWAVEAKSATATDLALFRSDHAKAVAAGAEQNNSPAMLSRQATTGGTHVWKWR